MGMIIQNSKQYFPARGCIYQNGKKFSRMKDLYTASGIIASFETDDANGIVECDCNIPYNAQGYTSIEISARGINIWNGLRGNVRWKDDGDYMENSNIISNMPFETSTQYHEIPCSPNTTYCFVDTLDPARNPGLYIVLYFSKRYSRSIQSPDSVYHGNTNITAQEFTTPANAYYMKFSSSYIKSHSRANVSINYPSTYNDYHVSNPKGSNTVISFGRTIYGGTYEAISGTLIGAYNADGTEKETPDVFSISPIPLEALTDEPNNIWSNCGEVTVKYYKSSK
jgi:hypothetical protein